MRRSTFGQRVAGCCLPPTALGMLTLFEVDARASGYNLKQPQGPSGKHPAVDPENPRYRIEKFRSWRLVIFHTIMPSALNFRLKMRSTSAPFTLRVAPEFHNPAEVPSSSITSDKEQARRRSDGPTAADHAKEPQ